MPPQYPLHTMMVWRGYWGGIFAEVSPEWRDRTSAPMRSPLRRRSSAPPAPALAKTPQGTHGDRSLR